MAVRYARLSRTIGLNEKATTAGSPRNVSRRAFLSTSAGAIGAATIGRFVAADEGEPIAAIDAHTHFYDPTRPNGVPWPGKQDKVLYRPMLPDEFKRLSKPQHIGGTIVVEASPWVEDNQWVLDLAARDPFLVGVVGHLEPHSDAFPGLLKRFAKEPRYRGIRVSHSDVKQSFEHSAQMKNLALLVEHDLELDVNGGPDMPADVARLAQELPDLRIVINHCGNLPIDGQAPPEAWRRGMQAAAQHQRVYCKVSALAEATRKTNRDAPTDVDFYAPELDALWDAFGADRLIYGSNWPVSERAAWYANVYAIVHGYFRAKGASVLKKFLRENAVAAYKPVL